MTAVNAARLPAGVFLSGDALAAARYAVRTAQEYRRSKWGLLPSRGLANLAVLLSEPGQADSPEEPAEEAVFMTTTEAAAQLGCTPRTVRRHAADDFGGRKVGGQWMVDRRCVDEHVAGAQ